MMNNIFITRYFSCNFWLLNMLVLKTRLIILIFCLGFFNNSLGQVLTKDLNQTPQELYEFHIKKKKANFIVGWVVLGGGVAMLIGGANTSLNNCLLSDCHDGEALAFSGIGVGLSSLVFFNKAWKHKKKAKIQLQNGTVKFNNEIKYSGISIVYSF